MYWDTIRNKGPLSEPREVSRQRRSALHRCQPQAPRLAQTPTRQVINDDNLFWRGPRCEFPSHHHSNLLKARRISGISRDDPGHDTLPPGGIWNACYCDFSNRWQATNYLLHCTRPVASAGSAECGFIGNAASSSCTNCIEFVHAGCP
jgi:hypothetical protein